MEFNTNELLSEIVTIKKSHYSPNSYYLAIPNSIRRFPYLSMKERNILTELYSWLGKKNENTVKISYEMMMFYTGIKSRNTIKKTLNGLKSKGYIDYYRFNKNDKYTIKLRPLTLNPHAIINSTILYFFEMYYYAKNWEGHHLYNYIDYKNIIRESVVNVIYVYEETSSYSETFKYIKSLLEVIDESKYWDWRLRGLIGSNISRDEGYHEVEKQYEEIMLEVESVQLELMEKLVESLNKKMIELAKKAG